MAEIENKEAHLLAALILYFSTRNRNLIVASGATNADLGHTFVIGEEFEDGFAGLWGRRKWSAFGKSSYPKLTVPTNQFTQIGRSLRSASQNSALQSFILLPNGLLLLVNQA